jgi:hypothetical protein
MSSKNSQNLLLVQSLIQKTVQEEAMSIPVNIFNPQIRLQMLIYNNLSTMII